jgi:hypothetical protein
MAETVEYMQHVNRDIKLAHVRFFLYVLWPLMILIAAVLIDDPDTSIALATISVIVMFTVIGVKSWRGG